MGENRGGSNPEETSKLREVQPDSTTVWCPPFRVFSAPGHAKAWTPNYFRGGLPLVLRIRPGSRLARAPCVQQGSIRPSSVPHLRDYGGRAPSRVPTGASPVGGGGRETVLERGYVRARKSGRRGRRPPHARRVRSPDGCMVARHPPPSLQSSILRGSDCGPRQLLRMRRGAERRSSARTRSRRRLVARMPSGSARVLPSYSMPT